MSNHRFTQGQIDYLRENVAGRSRRELTTLFNEHFGLQLSRGQISAAIKYRNINGYSVVMPRHNYTPEQIDYLTANVKGRSQRELTSMFNERFNLQKSVKQIHGVLDYRKLRNGLGRTDHHYTPEQIAFLKENVAGRTSYELMNMFNERFNLQKSVKQIQDAKTRRKLRSGILVRKAFVYKDRCSLPVGSEKHYANGTTVVKVAEPNKWRLKHVLIWEATNGPVPEGYYVIFGDRNKQNFDLDNLILATRNELSYICVNGMYQNDAELTKAGISVARIVYKVSERKTKIRIANELKVKVCPVCGKSYYDDSFFNYCSKDCRDTAYEALKEQQVKVDRSLYQYCIVCGKPIKQGTAGRIIKYCSRNCARLKRKHSLSSTARKAESRQ